MPLEDLNEILLHAVPNGWEKKFYIHGWDFDTKSYKAMCQLFERIEVAEKIYKSGNTSKNPIREDTNWASHGRNRKGGKTASPTNPETGGAGKCRTKMQAIRAISRPEEKYA